MEKGMKVAILFNLFLIAIVLLLTTFIGCRDSYIAGYALSPDTTQTSTALKVIYDQDSVVHWYVKIYEGDIWCYIHNQYEQVKHVRR